MYVDIGQTVSIGASLHYNISCSLCTKYSICINKHQHAIVQYLLIHIVPPRCVAWICTGSISMCHASLGDYTVVHEFFPSKLYILCCSRKSFKLTNCSYYCLSVMIIVCSVSLLNLDIWLIACASNLLSHCWQANQQISQNKAYITQNTKPHFGWVVNLCESTNWNPHHSVSSVK